MRGKLVQKQFNFLQGEYRTNLLDKPFKKGERTTMVTFAQENLTYARH